MAGTSLTLWIAIVFFGHFVMAADLTDGQGSRRRGLSTFLLIGYALPMKKSSRTRSH